MRVVFLLVATSAPTALSRQALQCSSKDGTCVGLGGDDGRTPVLPDDFADPCRDLRSECVGWAGEGECSNNPSYMEPSCAKSCGTCRLYLDPPDEKEDERLAEVLANGSLACQDDDPRCGEWADGGECVLNPGYMLHSCRYSCWQCLNFGRDREDGVSEDIIARKRLFVNLDFGKRQVVPDPPNRAEGLVEALLSMEYYSRYNITKPSVDPKARERCRNDSPHCASWAARGMCGLRGRIVDGDHEVPGINSGTKEDVAYMLDVCPLACGMCGLIEDFHKCAGRRHPLSPAMAGGQAMIESVRRSDAYEPVFAADSSGDDGYGPYVVIIRDFLSADEVEAMMGNPPISAKGVVGATKERIAAIVSCPVDHIELETNPESEPGSFRHSLEIDQLWKPAGPRVVSFHVMLSDDGGGMGFPLLDWLHVNPRRGTMVMWTNAKLDDPYDPDPLTSHEYFETTGGDERLQGVQFHARLYNFTDASMRGCA